MQAVKMPVENPGLLIVENTGILETADMHRSQDLQVGTADRNCKRELQGGAAGWKLQANIFSQNLQAVTAHKNYREKLMAKKSTQKLEAKAAGRICRQKTSADHVRRKYAHMI